MKPSSAKPYLSIIIPAHNEVLRLPATLKEVFAFASTQSYPVEIVVVENASIDNTFELASNLCRNYPNAQVISEPIKGKGQAVKRGMLAARGDYRLICDADLAMPVGEIPKFIPPQLTDCDIAIASREARGAKRNNEPFYRHLVGRIFNLLVRIIVLPKLQDTQCGYKCFRSEIIDPVFNQQTMTGWAFDVELLAIAEQLGYSIKEVPIDWYYGPRSQMRVFVDAPRMFVDLLKIRSNMHRNIYKKNGGTATNQS
jgi:dolichyl-phosphate beta-glucosyltransferase